jgi:ABC-2 type transport system ATP-binding protein
VRDIVIETKALRKDFGKPDAKDRKGRPKGVRAVDGVDLTIRRGEIFGMLGPNGAGKTTILSMLVTIHPPTSGTARVAGIDVAEDPGGVRKHVGIVFQEPTLDTLLTGRENLQLHGRLYGVPPREIDARADEMLRLVGLAERGHDQVKKYSGGMKRRLEIARGLMHRPEVLFLDEPTLGLDPATRESIWRHIRELRDAHGTTIVLTTHYMDEADTLCDRLAIIDKGKIVAEGTPRELKATLGGDIVVLTGAASGTRAVAERLAYVKKIEEKGAQLVLTVHDAPKHLAALIQACGAVESVEVRPVRLEDVFIAMTGRAMRDEEEGGEDWMDQLVSSQRGE